MNKSSKCVLFFKDVFHIWFDESFFPSYVIQNNMSLCVLCYTIELIPKPAQPCDAPPLYLRLRMGKPLNRKGGMTTPIMSYGKKKMKPEYWFSIPRDKYEPYVANMSHRNLQLQSRSSSSYYSPRRNLGKLRRDFREWKFLGAIIDAFDSLQPEVSPLGGGKRN